MISYIFPQNLLKNLSNEHVFFPNRIDIFWGEGYRSRSYVSYIFLDNQTQLKTFISFLCTLLLSSIQILSLVDKASYLSSNSEFYRYSIIIFNLRNWVENFKKVLKTASYIHDFLVTNM